MSVSSNEFKKALAHFASGITIATTKDSSNILHGITISSFCSVSLDPPLILICIMKNVGSHHAFIQSDSFVVNILAETQRDISNHFAFIHDDKFKDIPFSLNNAGLPVLDNCLVNLECRKTATHEAGDHTIFIGRVENALVNETQPLLYFHSRYGKIILDA